MSHRPTTLLALAAVLLASLSPSLALAEPRVTVHVRRGTAVADATVTVTDENGHTASCQTQQGQCSLSGLGPGRHQVVAVGSDGRRSESRTVMIPPDGEVSLFVSVP